jgi:hypothetical protein
MQRFSLSEPVTDAILKKRDQLIAEKVERLFQLMKHLLAAMVQKLEDTLLWVINLLKKLHYAGTHVWRTWKIASARHIGHQDAHRQSKCLNVSI